MSSEQDFYLAIWIQAERKFSLLNELGHWAQTEGAVARFGKGQVTPLLRALVKVNRLFRFKKQEHLPDTA